MTIELDEKTLNILANKIANIVVRKLRNQGADDVRLIPCAEAAKRLGITPDWMRKIKDNFSYIKRGDGKQSRLYFNADTLIQEYQRI